MESVKKFFMINQRIVILICKVLPKVSLITPVPGGVGPVTVSMLI